MKNIRPIIIFASAFLLLCVLASWLYSGFAPLPPLPPGYKLLCSTEGEQYSLSIPLSGGHDGNFHDSNVFNSARAAIEHAIWYEEFRTSESDQYTWEDCPETACEDEE